MDILNRGGHFKNDAKKFTNTIKLPSVVPLKLDKLYLFVLAERHLTYPKMQSAEYWINNLNLQPHPEGGFYKETYRATEVIPREGLPSRFRGHRNASTAIYFLLRSPDKSLFHRIKSDELWHFHSGNTLNIFVLTREGVITFKLGNNPGRGESLHVVIPANHWFGAIVDEQGGYTLSTCTVAPGFDFEDFELANRDKLLKDFPFQEEIIKTLTKP